MIELLSPAGNKEAFFAAINAGADAIYMGIDKYNARQMAENFSLEDYIECINFAHIFGVKVYLTMNTLLYSNEIKDALEIIQKLYNVGLDAVIVQDIGLASLIRKYFKDLPLHASTQMTIHSLKQVKYLEKLGFKRVVLARELSLDEINHISQNTKLELEVFIHGALCVSFSGQCLMSSMIGDRSGNRGMCAGTCRLPIKLMKKSGLVFSGHLLSKKDIYGVEYVDKLRKMGITSLKIEGRGKTKEYISLVTRKYRKCIDRSILDENDEKELLQMFSRSSKSDGYFLKVRTKESISYKTAKNTGLKLGEVLESKNSMIKIKLLEDIDMKDGIESEDGNSSTVVTCIRDENKVLVNSLVKKGNIVFLGDFKKAPKKGEIINKTSSKKLIDKENNYILNNQRKQEVILNITIKKDENIIISTYMYGKNIRFELECIPQIAISKGLTKEYLEEVINKNKTELFKYVINSIDLDDNLYLPLSTINEIRRKISSRLIESVKIDRKLNIDFNNLDENLKNLTKQTSNLYNESLFVYKLKEQSIPKINSRKEEIVYINISDIMRLGEDVINNIKKTIYLYIPNIILSNLEKYIDENLERLISKYSVKGVLIGGLHYLEYINNIKEKYDIKVIIDYSLNVNNIYSAFFYKERGADMITFSPEVKKEEIENIKKKINVEIINDMVTVMTTRYCVIKSFDSCNCKNEDYYLEDGTHKKYNIVTDTIDCVSKYVRNNPKKIDVNGATKRNNIIS